jgi:hypothetical protein
MSDAHFNVAGLCGQRFGLLHENAAYPGGRGRFMVQTMLHSNNRSPPLS